MVLTFSFLDLKKDKRQKQKLQDDLYKTRLSRLKLSQKVPLAIRDVRPEGVIHHFMLSSEYERTLWTEAINECKSPKTEKETRAGQTLTFPFHKVRIFIRFSDAPLIK